MDERTPDATIKDGPPAAGHIGRSSGANVNDVAQGPQSVYGITDLSDEMLVALFCAIDSAADAYRLAAASRTFWRIANDPALWRSAFRHRGGPPIDDSVVEHLGHGWLWLCCALKTPGGTGVGHIRSRSLPYIYLGEMVYDIPHGRGLLVTTTSMRDHQRDKITAALVEPGGVFAAGAWICGTWSQGRSTKGRCAFATEYLTFEGLFWHKAKEGQSSWMRSFRYEGTALYSRGKVDRYVGQLRGSTTGLLKHGGGTAEYRNGDRYEGGWRKNKRHGRGALFETNGGIHEGDWCRGDKHGPMVETDAKEGSHFEGSYQCGTRHGRGTISWDDGKRFEGEWEDNKSARGMLVWPDGSRYEGDVRYARRSGNGTVHYASGERYEGGWYLDHHHGRGTMHYADGGRYEGEWLLGSRCGEGTMRYGDGGRYEGQWECDKRHGRGIMVYADGGRYEGPWHFDWRQGVGVMQYADGAMYKGLWRDDKRHGRGAMRYANGAVYKGPWRNDKRRGYGTMHYANGDRYEGGWGGDKRHACGTMNYANGDRYEGTWKNDQRHGHGIMIYVTGERYEGEWSRDKKRGRGILTRSDGYSCTVHNVDWDTVSLSACALLPVAAFVIVYGSVVWWLISMSSRDADQQ